MRLRHHSEAIQVCLELTPFNREREQRGVVKAAALPGRKRKAVILTMNQRDQIAVEGTRIDVQPAWEWLMRA
jgi:hypothetical protein